MGRGVPETLGVESEMIRTVWRAIAVAFSIVCLVCVAWHLTLGITEDTTPLQWALQAGVLVSLGLAAIAEKLSRRRPKAGEWRGR